MYGVLTQAEENMDQLFRDHPAVYLRSLEAMRKRQVELENLYGGEPIGSLPSPLFLDRSRWQPVQHKVSQLRAVLERVALGLLEKSQFQPLLGFENLHADLVETSAQRPGRPSPITRIDGMISEEGRFQVVEVNTDGSTGIHDCFSLAESARGTEALESLCESRGLTPSSLYEPLAEVFRQLWKDNGESGSPRVAIVDWEIVKSRYEQQYLARKLTSLGVPTIWCDPRQLTRRKGRLHGPDGPVDIVYKRVLSAELMQRSGEVRDYLEAVLAQQVLQINPFTADILYDKGLMALVQEPDFQEHLSAEEISLVQEMLPLARFFPGDDELMELALGDRENLVLKPRTEYGGKGVVLGNRVNQGTWEEALVSAQGTEKFLLQGYVEPNMHPVWTPTETGCRRQDLYSTIGLWLMGDETPGFYFRAGPSPVINVSGGAYGLPVLTA